MDISHILQFVWMGPVLYLDHMETFPNSKEQGGYFVGFAENVGDTLTFKVLKEDMRMVLFRSVVRSALDPKDRNKRVHFRGEAEYYLEKIDPE